MTDQRYSLASPREHMQVINVGGKSILVSSDTLKYVPNTNLPTLILQGEPVFLCRDPEPFELLLSFIRHGAIPAQKDKQDSLVREAITWNVTCILDLLWRMHISPDHFEHIMGCCFNGFTVYMSIPIPINIHGRCIPEVYRHIHIFLDLHESDLSGVNFSGMNFSGSRFVGCILEGANFTDAGLMGVNFHGARFNGANFTRANLSHADLSNAAVRPSASANFSDANLTGARLYHANLANCNFSGAAMRNCDFNRADLRGSDLTNTNVTVRYSGGFQKYKFVEPCEDPELSQALKDYENEEYEKVIEYCMPRIEADDVPALVLLRVVYDTAPWCFPETHSNTFLPSRILGLLNKLPEPKTPMGWLRGLFLVWTGSYRKGIALLHENETNAACLTELGICYNTGKGVSKNLAMAFACFNGASAINHILACHYVGLCYLEAFGVGRNVEMALQHLKLAAERGCAQACHKLAEIYARGPMDNESASRFLHRAAEQGYIYSQHDLSKVYEWGRLGVKQDEEAASRWMSLYEFQRKGEFEKLQVKDGVIV